MAEFISRLISGSALVPSSVTTSIAGAVSNLGSHEYGLGGISSGEPAGNGNGGFSTGESTFDWDKIIDLIGGIAPDIVNQLTGAGEALGLSNLGGVTGKRIYNNVFIQNGKIKVPTTSGYRTLGYTANFAKKKYRTRRRRKRLTKRDMAILAAIQQNPNASAALTMML